MWLHNESSSKPCGVLSGVKAEDDDTPRPPRFAPLERRQVGQRFLSLSLLPRRPPPRVGDDSDEADRTNPLLSPFPPSLQEHFDETAVATAASQGPRACVEELAARLPSRDECFRLSRWKSQRSKLSQGSAGVQPRAEGRRPDSPTGADAARLRCSCGRSGCMASSPKALISFGGGCCGVSEESCADPLLAR